LKFDESGLAKRGLLLRHLVMPDDVAGSEAIMQFLAEEISRETYVNIVDQYYRRGKLRVSNLERSTGRCARMSTNAR
jgi:putative pyruvate formate lyase activating enzyme